MTCHDFRKLIIRLKDEDKNFVIDGPKHFSDNLIVHCLIILESFSIKI